MNLKLVVNGLVMLFLSCSSTREKLKRLKSGLMTDLLTGRVRVPEGIAVAS
jgi:hypothetical protein